MTVALGILALLAVVVLLARMTRPRDGAPARVGCCATGPWPPVDLVPDAGADATDEAASLPRA